MRSVLDGMLVRVGDYYNRDGTTNSNDNTVERSVDINIGKVITHEGYQLAPTLKNDIALIRLETCVEFE